MIFIILLKKGGDFIFYISNEFYEILFKLFLALIIGGIIGFEREGIKRPAGFRTHILVCVGSTLIMLCGIHIYNDPRFGAASDPTRLGAQIVSGMGFLGAGTIIRNGSSVKGLTTAAGLWTISGIGIAIGSGFYEGAIIASLMLILSLFFFSKVEGKISFGTNEEILYIKSINKAGQIGKISTLFGEYNIKIRDIKVETKDEKVVTIKIRIIVPRRIDIWNIIENLVLIDGIKSANRHE